MIIFAVSQILGLSSDQMSTPFSEAHHAAVQDGEPLSPPSQSSSLPASPSSHGSPSPSRLRRVTLPEHLQPFHRHRPTLVRHSPCACLSVLYGHKCAHTFTILARNTTQALHLTLRGPHSDKQGKKRMAPCPGTDRGRCNSHADNSVPGFGE